MSAELIDQIYECALRSDLWPATLDQLSKKIAGRGGVLFTARERVFRWTASSELKPVFRRYFEEGWLTRCTRKSCLLSQTSPGFITEFDVWTQEEVERNPTYRNFLRPLGLGWSAGTALRLPTGDDLVFSFERDYDKGPIESPGVASLNALLPHLSRSAFIAARLSLEKARGSVEALEALNLPAAVVDTSGTIEVANALSRSIPGVASFTETQRLILDDRRAQIAIDSALASSADRIDNTPLSIVMRDKEDRPQLILHVVPIRRSASEIFERGCALVVFSPVAHPKVVSIDLVRSLFDLSPAEARVARHLADGEVPKQIARRLNVSVETVRFHLKQIFKKTGSRRQVDLVRILNGSFVH